MPLRGPRRLSHTEEPILSASSDPQSRRPALTRRSFVLGSAGATVAGLAIAGNAAPAQASPREPLVVLDVRPFVAAQSDSKRTYDYLKLLTAIQGLVNRHGPRLYLIGEVSDVARQHDFQTGEFWLGRLRERGGLLHRRTVERTSDVMAVIDRFARHLRGVVVWDPKVPATANVASTAAGVERLLPVRADTASDSPYHHLVHDLRMRVRLDLVDRFTGTGMIWGTRQPSTGSAKNDAYLWAKRRWLDTGRTNPRLMEYAPDGMPQNALSSGVVSLAVPAALQTGQTMPVSITITNTSTQTWTAATQDRLGAAPTNQFEWGDRNGGYANSVTNQRVFLDADVSVAPGESVTVDFSITAPDSPGTYALACQMVRDGVQWYAGTDASVTVTVTTQAQPTDPPAPRDYHPAPAYPNLFNSLIYDADYYIAQKAFFFDLSPDSTSAPNDDPEQPVGTDTRTLRALLLQQYRRAHGQIFTVGGFVPWWLKYTTYVDPNANLGPVPAEWAYADIISDYGGQMDADAAGLAGLFNASVYCQQELPRRLRQKAATSPTGEQRVPGRKYVTFYMGDYDAASWTAGSLPALWQDPARGSLPLAWAPDTGLSARVPQVFSYLYATQSDQDFFVGGDNGAGYLNPERLLAANRPDNLPDGLATWTRYTAGLYRRFDIKLTGFLISGNSGRTSLPVQKAFATFSSAGVGTNAGFDEPLVDGTPFMSVAGSPSTASAEAYGEGLAGLLQGRDDNVMIRNVLVAPSLLRDAVAYVRSHYPDIDFEVVDPYTNMAFYAEAKPWEKPKPMYAAPRTATPPVIDGAAQPGEWAAVPEITVSTSDPTVQEWGKVWGIVADGFATHYRVDWDAENLYLFEQRSQAGIAFTADSADLWGSSASALFLTPTEPGPVSDYTVMVSPSSPSGSPLIYLRTRGSGGGSIVPLDGARIASVLRSDGYTMELAVPWADLRAITPAAGATVRFTPLATVKQDSGDWGQVMWVGNGDDYLRWADLTFT